MPAFSSRLTRILQLETLNPAATMDLRYLATQIIKEFPDQRISLEKLFSCNGTRTKGWLCQTLVQVVEHDSKVRDFISIGHLAKLLARIHYVDKNIKLIGLPNPLFDQISLDERTEYFKKHFHGIDSEIASNPYAREILETEKAIMFGEKSN